MLIMEWNKSLSYLSHFTPNLDILLYSVMFWDSNILEQKID